MGKFDFSVIRNLRKKKGITSDELARQAGLTRGTIAKIESRNSNPTIDTIEALSTVFQLTSSELIRIAETAQCDEAAARPFHEDRFEGIHLVFPNFEIYHLRAEAGARKQSDPKKHENTSEVCLVLSGRVKVTVAGQSHELGPGAALRFKAIHEHEYAVVEEADILLIHHAIV
ncbi:helix-turn-helix domain-containing protein [Desulfolutivibrio sp.]|uniref:helix-turn-helix domain-containing protein n=1 Tax=Desulfolutivibrio sp. TaxID=2773296 RepID=UPI002F9683F2